MEWNEGQKDNFEIVPIYYSCDIKHLHLDLSPELWAEFCSQCEKISDFIWSLPHFAGHNEEGKSKNLQYVGVRIFSQILDIFVVHSIQFFILIFFLKLDQNCCF